MPLVTIELIWDYQIVPSYGSLKPIDSDKLLSMVIYVLRAITVLGFMITIGGVLSVFSRSRLKMSRRTS